jgi:membrane fusion protein (multidrug efflux system)
MTTEPITATRLAEPAAKKRRVPRWVWAAGPLLVVAVFAWQWVAGTRHVGTDNAYVKAERVLVSGQVAGRVVDVAVGQNEAVKAGQLLFRLDPQPLQLALAQAEAHLAQVADRAGAGRASVRGGDANVRAAQAALTLARQELARQQGLVARQLVARQSLDQARESVASAQAQLDAAVAARDQAQESLGGRAGSALAQLPEYQAALAERDQARLDLAHAEVRAPVDGVVGGHDLQVGEYLAVGQVAMPLVATAPVWIEANFKETDLAHLRVGQPAQIEIDSYPGQHWQARVASISPASGSEFSVLPAQNASGNWVKVVQRIPVRFEITGLPHGAPVLRAGMSAEVDVDLRAAPAHAATAAR